MASGEPLTTPLRKIEGRTDLRRIVSPDPTLGKTVETSVGGLTLLHGLTEFSQIRWEGIDFSDSRLNSLRFHDSVISNCMFNECSCEDWRIWSTSFKNCSFRDADLRGASLGAVDGGKRNRFEDILFEKTDLRDTSYTSTEFIRCVFRNAKLNKVDFQGSVFTDCVFEGELREVIFYDRGFNGKDLPPNEMLRVDFSKAHFRYVEFRRLNLETVEFPESDEHIIIDDFPKVLDGMLSALRPRNDDASKRLGSHLAFKKKWLGPNQRRGVLVKKDILAASGQEGLDFVLAMLT